MSKVFVTTALVASFAAGTAFAGGYVAPVVDVEPVVAVVAAPASWAGGYVGANLNYGKGKLKANGDLAELADEFGIGSTLLKPDGVSGALRAGYDWQNGAAVYGLGAEYNLGKYKDSRDLTVALNPDAPEDIETVGSINAEIKNMATIFARAGYAFNDQFMAYGLLGYSRAKANASFAVEDGGESYSRTVSGATYGIGAEYRINQNWSSYAEYTHTDFGKVKDTDGLLKLEVDQVKLGVNYRF